MKKVFNSHSALAHAWANQLQSEGRASSMFFEGPVIYSYGHHYEIARFIQAPNGENICFVNSNGYSNSTAKHTNHVRQAIPANVRTFSVPFSRGMSYYGNVNHIDIQSLPFVIEKLTLNAKNCFFDQLKAKSKFNYYSEGIYQYEQAFTIAKLFNLPLPVMPENEQEAFDKAEQLRLTENDRQEKKAQREIEKSIELLHKWLNHEYNGQLYNIPVHLRVSKDGNLIETTKGARVSFDAAKRLLSKLVTNQDVKGEKIDGFTVLENTDQFVKIGCHTISWPIINNFFNL